MNATNTTCSFPISDFNEVKNKMLSWVSRFSIFCFLDNHQYQMKPHSLECLVAAGTKRIFQAGSSHSLTQLQSFIDEKKGWLFGHLGYDLKNELEMIRSSHPDPLEFPDVFFFEPLLLVRLTENEMIIDGGGDEYAIYSSILASPPADPAGEMKNNLNIRPRISKQEYSYIIDQIRHHILRGDCYELNFCQEFFDDHAEINPVAVYRNLSRISPSPFSAFYRIEDKYLVCASPERYIKKHGSIILSQPMKGTSPRFLNDAVKDEASKNILGISEKERSENVMVVDLVRNDLARVCMEGSVRVDELYGVYSFPQVHQMISTVSGKLPDKISFQEIIRATFPMGSMTGAPKKRVLELIEQYEKTKRGIFSGALGYIDPSGDFDFNVVIRSIMYHAGKKYLSYQVGSGITFYSDADKEYEECLMKAVAMETALTGAIS